MNRTITLRLGTLLTILGMCSGAVGGYLVRRDVQTVTQTEVRGRLESIEKQITGISNEIEFARAYLRSLREWAIRVSAKQGWPEPGPTVVPGKETRHHEPFLFPNAYAEDPKPITEESNP